MRAAILTKINAPLEIMELETLPLEFGQVLVKVLVSGLCGAQLHEIRGHKGNEKFLPHLMGHEGCGIVQEIGPGVTQVAVGDKVVMHWRLGSGIESAFPQYKLGNRTITSGKVTTLAENTVVSENRLTRVPSDTPDEFAALLGCGLSTALGILNNECDLRFGESIAVVGCGGVGLSVLQAAKLASANPIIGIDIQDSKRNLALSCGADFFINSGAAPLDEQLHPIAGLNKLDIIIDTTGNPRVIALLSELLSDSGRLIMVGQPAPGSSVSFLGDASFFGSRGKSIKSTQGGKTNPSEDIARYISLQKAGKLQYEPSVTHRFNLSQVNQAFETLTSGEAGRIMIHMGETNV